MTKMTAKYTAAQAAARAEKLPLPYTAEDLYAALAKRNYFWNSGAGEWECKPIEDADPPTQLIRLRVWADAEMVEDVAEDAAKVLEADGFTLVEKSPVYICRPPKQLEARVYLTFQPPAKRKG